MLIRLHTTATAQVREEWLIHVPDTFAEDVLRDPNGVMTLMAVEADIVVEGQPVTEIVSVEGRTFDSAELAIGA